MTKIYIMLKDSFFEEDIMFSLHSLDATFLKEDISWLLTDEARY